MALLTVSIPDDLLENVKERAFSDPVFDKNTSAVVRTALRIFFDRDYKYTCNHGGAEDPKPAKKSPKRKNARGNRRQ